MSTSGDGTDFSAAPVTEAEWSEWSECDTYIQLMTRYRCSGQFECHEEYMSCEVKGDGIWGEWGECVEFFQERERCGEYGCEIEEQDCGVVEEEGIRYGDEDSVEWGRWEDCTNGYRSREKCFGEYCITEEDACQDGSWSEWGPCEKGSRERTRCSQFLGCEMEEMYCEQEHFPEQWTSWGSCTDGYQSRERCIAGYGCSSEERVCGGSSSDWSEWGPCEGEYQERERCGHGGCQIETKSCGRKESYNWSEWGPCTNDAQERSKCDGVYGCYTEERPCIHEREIIRPLVVVSPPAETMLQQVSSVASGYLDYFGYW